LFFGGGKEKPDLAIAGGKLLNNEEEVAFGTSFCWDFKESDGKYELLFLGGGRAVKMEEEEELHSPLGRGGGNENIDSLRLGLKSMPFSSSESEEAEA
jgi:hypothetical protein